MSIMQIEILDPKAEIQLRDLAERGLIAIQDSPEIESTDRSQRKTGWGKDIVAKVSPSSADPLEEFDEGDGIAKYPRTFGYAKGEMTILPSFYDPMEEFKEYE